MSAPTFTRHPTKREIVATERGERSTILKLACGHDRAIGSDLFETINGVRFVAHAMTGMFYPCCDGHCGRSRA